MQCGNEDHPWVSIWRKALAPQIFQKKVKMRQVESEAMAHGGGACDSKTSTRTSRSQATFRFFSCCCASMSTRSSHLISHPIDKNQQANVDRRMINTSMDRLKMIATTTTQTNASPMQCLMQVQQCFFFFCCCCWSNANAKLAMHKVMRHQRLPKITQHQKPSTRPHDDSDQAGKEIDVMYVSPQSTTESEQPKYPVSMLVGRSWDMRGEGRGKWWRSYIEGEEDDDGGMATMQQQQKKKKIMVMMMMEKMMMMMMKTKEWKNAMRQWVRRGRKREEGERSRRRKQEWRLEQGKRREEAVQTATSLLYLLHLLPLLPHIQPSSS